MIDDNIRFRRLPDAVSTDLGEETAVLNMRNGAYLGLNATAAFVWHELETPCTAAMLRDRLAAAFAVEESICAAAVQRLLNRLESEGVIERLGGAEA